MIGHNKQKLIQSLALKKYRDKYHMFVAEGPKLVQELWGTFECHLLIHTSSFRPQLQNCPQQKDLLCEEISEEELKKISFLQTPQNVLAVFACRQESAFNPQMCEKNLCLALDGVQDPGNVGTILRLADWFGIEHVLCSPDTADVYSPKTVQATMGALARVHVHRQDFAQTFSLLGNNVPIYGTFLDGQEIQTASINNRGILVMGNEGQGIRPETESHITHKLFIPPFPSGRTSVESLNVAIATAIACQEFRRRISNPLANL